MYEVNGFLTGIDRLQRWSEEEEMLLMIWGREALCVNVALNREEADRGWQGRKHVYLRSLF